MNERREDYRILCEAAICLKPVNEGHVEEQSPRGYFMNQEFMAFAKAYDDLSDRSSDALARLGKLDSAIADALSLVDQKLNLIEQRFHITESTSESQLIKLSLSASGARFIWHEYFHTGSFIAIRFTLFPGQQLVYTFAEILRCESQGNGDYEFAIKFFQIGAQETQILRRHIMQAERETLRKDSTANV